MGSINLPSATQLLHRASVLKLLTPPRPPPPTPHTEKASALSAAVNWVFRDGVGMTCSLVFSSLAATSFDGNIKEWRLFADVINDAGLTLGERCPRVPVLDWDQPDAHWGMQLARRPTRAHSTPLHHPSQTC